MSNYIIVIQANCSLCLWLNSYTSLSSQMNKLHIITYAWLKGGVHSSERRLVQGVCACVCVCVRSVMRGEKWAQATKDLCWEESWNEEFAPEHKRRCVGISSKRISHLIKASAQLPGGLYATPSSFMQTSQCCRTYENQCKCRGWGVGGHVCFYGSLNPPLHVRS